MPNALGLFFLLSAENRPSAMDNESLRTTEEEKGVDDLARTLKEDIREVFKFQTNPSVS